MLTSGTAFTSIKVVLWPMAALIDSMPYLRAAMNDGDRLGIFGVYYYSLCPPPMRCTTIIMPDKAFLDPTLILETVRYVAVTLSLDSRYIPVTSPLLHRHTAATPPSHHTTAHRFIMATRPSHRRSTLTTLTSPSLPGARQG